MQLNTKAIELFAGENCLKGNFGNSYLEGVADFYGNTLLHGLHPLGSFVRMPKPRDIESRRQFIRGGQEESGPGIYLLSMPKYCYGFKLSQQATISFAYYSFNNFQTYFYLERFGPVEIYIYVRPNKELKKKNGEKNKSIKFCICLANNCGQMISYRINCLPVGVPDQFSTC